MLTCLDLNPLAELSKDDQVKNDGSCKEGVFAGVVHHYGVEPSHTDLRGVFIHCTLAITHERYILDDNLVREVDKHR